MKKQIFLCAVLLMFLIGCHQTAPKMSMPNDAIATSDEQTPGLQTQTNINSDAQTNSDKLTNTGPTAKQTPKKEFPDYDPYRLAEFPMGCQYKGYELCNPIFDLDELGDENIDLGDGYIYAPMTRLYFPDDWMFNIRESTSKTATLEDYLGKWWPSHKWSTDGEVKRLSGDSLEIMIGGDIYTCPEQVVKGRDYLIYFCHMDKEFSARYNVIRPAKEPFDAYLEITINLEKDWFDKADVTVKVAKYLPCLQSTPTLDHYWNQNAYLDALHSPLCKSQHYPYGQDNYWKREP